MYSELERLINQERKEAANKKAERDKCGQNSRGSNLDNQAEQQSRNGAEDRKHIRVRTIPAEFDRTSYENLSFRERAKGNFQSNVWQGNSMMG